MKLGIMQPYFFPYLGYFQGIHAVDKYILYDRLAYIKDGWMNRNRFLVIRGNPTYFIVEIKQKSSYKKISDVELVDNNHWRKKMLRSIFVNYKSSPFFNEIYPLIESVVNTETCSLKDLNAKSITIVSQYLEIKTKIVTETSIYAEIETQIDGNDTDLFSRFSSIQLAHPEKKVIRIVEICRVEGADIFINAIGGRKLYDKDEFRKNGIELFFVQTNPYSYPQPAATFFRDLSIIDVLMNCGKTGTQSLLNEYTLI